jgi:hypothetical protein
MHVDGQAQVQREATDKESLTVRTEGCPADFNHFRDVTKMVRLDSDLPREVDHVKGFTTRRVENPSSHLPLTLQADLPQRAISTERT